MAHPAPSKPKSSRRWWAAALAVATVSLAVVGFRTLNSSARPPLPDPNGYDDFVRAGEMVVGPVPNQGNWTTADLGELRTFVAANRATLDRAGVGFGRPAAAPPAEGQHGLDRAMVQVQAIRALSRLLLAEGRVAREDGHPAAAVDASFRIAELGQATTQGALLIGVQTGWAIEMQAMDQIRTLADRLPPADLSAGLSRLADLDRRCPTLAEAMVVDDRWYKGAFSWPLRMMMDWQGVRAKAMAPALQAQRTARDRVVRGIRSAQLAWAARLFEHENGRPPLSAAELAPTILPAVPTDPATGRSMDLAPAGPPPTKP